MKPCAKCKQVLPDEQFGRDKRNKNGLASYCKACHNSTSNAWAHTHRESRNIANRHHHTLPWNKAYKHISERCLDPKHQSYPYYGGKGVERRITRKELKELFFRDNGPALSRPSIDRKDSNGHYEFGNCQWIEYADNCRKGGN